MNAFTSVKPDVDNAAWADAIGAVNAWRGQALQCFARAELAASETLLALAALPAGGKKVSLRHLVGQRFGDLRAAVDPNGPFAAEGEKAASALAAFREYEVLRPLFCHGVAKVALGDDGEWQFEIRLLAFRNRKEERSSRTYTLREAEAVLERLKKASRKLASSLESLRARAGK